MDLIYLNPPINSKGDYNLLFKSPKGVTSEAQIQARNGAQHPGDEPDLNFKKRRRRKSWVERANEESKSRTRINSAISLGVCVLGW